MSDLLFPQNESSADRISRVFLGVFLLTLVFAGPQSYLGLVGLVPLLTGLAGRCPLYRLFGWSTCSVSQKAM